MTESKEQKSVPVDSVGVRIPQMDDAVPKITVRFVNDHKTGKCWFEEQVRDQWVQIQRTVMSCEGNSRHELEKEIEERRQKRLLIHRTYSGTQEFTV